MSCAQVMYQPYAPYLPYDRSASSSSEVSDKRYRLHDGSSSADGSSYPSNYLLLGRPPYSAASSSGNTSAGIDGSAPSTSSDSLAPATNVSIGSPSPIAGPSSVVASPSVIVPQPKSGSLHIQVKDFGNESDSEEAHHHQHREAQYLSANCVVFVNYSGDASSIVDEHFHRALSQKYSSDGGSSLSQRSFPPSFWNSNYQPPKQSAAYAGSSHGAPTHATHHDLFSQAEAYHAHAVASLHNHHAHHAAAAHHAHLAAHQADPWHYSLSSQAYPHNLTGSYPGVSGSRFTPQYGSFLLQPGHPSRIPAVSGVPASAAAAHCSVKSEPWTGRYPDTLPFSTELGHPIDATSYSAAAAATGHPYTNMSGLETSQVQEPAAKDLYWF